MRSFFAIFSLLLLVSFQAADACCDHDAGGNVHIEMATEGQSNQFSKYSQHQHHDGPCGCLCHQKLPTDKISFTVPLLEVKPHPMIEVCDWNSCADHFLPMSTGPPLAGKFSLPPSSATEICSQHCRFLL
ncbi:MAG: hypothetical protein ACI9FG_000856 [Crocinitomicaceae bacterium]|jgi:hypothetical protein